CWLAPSPFATIPETFRDAAMPFAIDPTIASPNILVATFYPPVEVEHDHYDLLAQTHARLDGGIATLYRVLDFRSAYMNFTDLIRWLAADTAPDLSGGALDPRIHTVLVSNSDDTDRIAAWLRQEQYGRLEIPLFTSTDDALI